MSMTCCQVSGSNYVMSLLSNLKQLLEFGSDGGRIHAGSFKVYGIEKSTNDLVNAEIDNKENFSIKKAIVLTHI